MTTAEAFLPLDLPEWMHRAACADHPDPDLWFPEPGACQRGMQAKQICVQHCPVVMECRSYAIANNIRHGIWGGMRPEDRLPKYRGRFVA